MTTGISLVRENAESLKPPRSLWVTFPLGRPLGKPNDPAFQHRVIAAALELLQRRAGPVLEDFPEDVPTADLEDAPACPVSFPKKVTDSDAWGDHLAAELALLKPWYDLGKRRRKGRTLFGVSSRSIEEVLNDLAGHLEAETLPLDDLKTFKRLLEDAKIYYTEALTAQPGEHVFELVQKTLWRETVLGAGLTLFYEKFREHPDFALFARLIAPREAVGESTGAEVEIGVNETRVTE